MERRRLWLVIGLSVVALVAIVAIVVALTTPAGAPVSTPTASSTPSPTPSSTPSVQPEVTPTESPAPTTTTAPDLSQVSVAITRARYFNGQASVGAFVAGTVESGGQCSLELVNGSSRFTAQSTASPDATTTICADLIISEPLSPGIWTATVTYISDVSTGVSDPAEIEVQ